jgi:hypothetical protein
MNGELGKPGNRTDGALIQVLYLYLPTGAEEIHDKSVMTAGASNKIEDTRR